jgi:hypothetical protein
MPKRILSYLVIILSLSFLFIIIQTTTSLLKIDAINSQEDIFTPFNIIHLSGTSNPTIDKLSDNETNIDTNTDTPKHYLNSTYGIEINYPEGWVVNEGHKATIFHNQSKSLNVVAELLAPIQSSYYDSKIGASHNSLRLIVENYSTFGVYTNDNIQKYLGNKDSEEENRDKLLNIANKRIGAIGLYCHNFDLKSWNQNASLAGYPAHQIFLDYSYDKYSKDATELWAIKNDKIYIIEFVAQDQYYTQYLPVVNKMLKSFQIL